MKSHLTFGNGNGNTSLNMQSLANSKVLSDQIENLRVVLRRMQKNDSASPSLDSLIDQKLKSAK